ncbi:hypothetical protein LWI28_004106 [Acer negundo]|uniref:Uncharacterized protein n=1 Tax=Acer negundo TaxID=4023 RepID=A0AAD5ID65_ACENE|nr:hypothetical protein LWI28_004106 [Acer negundo]
MNEIERRIKSSLEELEHATEEEMKWMELEQAVHHGTCHATEEEMTWIDNAVTLVRKVIDESQPLESKWKRIESTWMDTLGYAARKCNGNEHAQQLSSGGEFLTHVWLLLCHLMEEN